MNTINILTDCDGVLLNWEAGFEEWMNEKGYVKIPDHDVTAYGLHVHYGIPRSQILSLITEFNHSDYARRIPAFRDARLGVYALTKMGYQFDIITSFSDDPKAYENRLYNLKTVFPTIIIRKLVCLPLGADKDEYLNNHYKDTGLYWIEDKDLNAVAGINAGLKSVLMEHDHNIDYQNDKIIKVKNWSEFFNLITL